MIKIFAKNEHNQLRFDGLFNLLVLCLCLVFLNLCYSIIIVLCFKLCFVPIIQFFLNSIFKFLQMAMAVPKWSDIFSGLKPYEDPNEVDAFDFEEVGDPRFGIVQVIHPLSI